MVLDKTVMLLVSCGRRGRDPSLLSNNKHFFFVFVVALRGLKEKGIQKNLYQKI
jgi:hypothetical protein